MDLIEAFDQISTSMREAEVSRSRTVAEVQAEQCGLEKVEPGPAGQRTHWQRVLAALCSAHVGTTHRKRFLCNRISTSSPWNCSMASIASVSWNAGSRTNSVYFLGLSPTR
jgi:hypothetical protein